MRNLTEWTSGNPHMCMDQSTISEGIGGITWGSDINGKPGVVNVRQKFVQGSCGNNLAGTSTAVTGGEGWHAVPVESVGNGVTLPGTTRASLRRYQIQLACGLFTQEKLIPTKFMASQLAVEITLEQAKGCIFQPLAALGTDYITGAVENFFPTYWVSDVNLIPEVLEFDGSYDDMFLKGLQSGGVPIKFSSWHSFFFSSAKSQNVNLQVQERSRSVKALFTVQRRAQPNYAFDNGATYYDTGTTGNSTLQNYQYRIGSRFFPASPVQCSTYVGSSKTNGGAEAFIELQKALNVIGDYRLSTPVNATRWGLQSGGGGNMHDLDFVQSLSRIDPTGGFPQSVNFTDTVNSFAGDTGSQCFTMAVSLETSSGLEISGLNAEEQVNFLLTVV